MTDVAVTRTVAQQSQLGGSPSVVHAAQGNEPMRRLLNLGVALVAIAFFLPLMALVALLIKVRERDAPVLFRHNRIGRDGRTFGCLKFRTMLVDAEARLQDLLANDELARAEWHETHKLRADPRITPLGAFLRKTSLDELPQLFNVLGGEMNIVGPRPIVQAEVKRYGHFFPDYCSVLPGITGLWQVAGRSDTTYRRRVAMDVIYARRRGLLMDAAIMAKTLPAVLLRRGSY